MEAVVWGHRLIIRENPSLTPPLPSNGSSHPGQEHSLIMRENLSSGVPCQAMEALVREHEHSLMRKQRVLIR
jgi:hypothetical protein